MNSIPPHIATAIKNLPSPICAYIYDLKKFTQQIEKVRTALPDSITTLYAMKANPHPALVEQASRACHGIEVASGGELTTALAAGASRIIFGGPAKTDEELRAAAQCATPLIVNIESTQELRRLNLIAHDAGKIIDIALRVNRPTSSLSGSHQMTGRATPFGIEAAALPSAIALAQSQAKLRLCGLHLHAVSNNLDAESHAEFIADSIDYAHDMAREFGIAMDIINVGGGIGVDPTGTDRFDLNHLATRLRGLDTTGVTIELGRYLAAACGWYACEVLDIKRNHGRNFAVVRGGTHHFRLPAAWGYSHPVEVLHTATWNYPWPRPELINTTVDITGELCTPRDVLARDIKVSQLRVGDVLVLPGTGAYGWTISHHDFLSHPHPETVLLH